MVYDENSYVTELFSKGGKYMNRNIFSIGKYIFKVHDKFCEKISTKYGLTNLELNILFFLKSNPGLDTARDISEKMHLSKSNISDAVDCLTKKGYLTGIQDEKDRRYIHLKLRNEAESILESSLSIHEEFIKSIIKDIPEDKLKTAKEVLDKMLINALNESENM